MSDTDIVKKVEPSFDGFKNANLLAMFPDKSLEETQNLEKNIKTWLQETNTHIEKLNKGEQASPEEKKNYEELKQIIVSVNNAMATLFDVKAKDNELNDAKMMLKTSYKTLQNNKSLQGSNNPFVESIVVGIYNFLNFFVTAINKIQESQNQEKKVPSITLFSTFKTKSKTLVEDLGKLINEVDPPEPTKSSYFLHG